MKVCYIDETGMASKDELFVMVGIVADTHRVGRTREEFKQVFADIQDAFPGALRELKARKVFYGRDKWRNVNPDFRKGIFGWFSEWIRDRKHKLALAAIDPTKHAGAVVDDVPDILRDVWLAGALHIALQVQEVMQYEEQNKGHTFLIFDENKAQVDRLAELLYDPPIWTDTFYNRGTKQAPLDQVIDTAFFAKSHHAGLVQVADLFAFVFQRWSELEDYGLPEEFGGEKAVIKSYLEILSPRLLRRSARWPTATESRCAAWFNDLAPLSLKKLKGV